MAQVTWGDLTIDTATLHEKSTVALLRRGLAHFLGNEQASKVASWMKSFEKSEGREPTDDEKAAKKAEYVEKAIAALWAGEIGMGVRGPAVSPLEREVERLARGEVMAVLKSNGIKPPRGDEAVKFANGAEFTLEQLIERRIGAHGERLEKEAQKKLAADEKRRKAAEAEAAKLRADGDATVENLGL